MLKSQKDFAALDRMMLETYQRCPLRILSYCIMGNHWHFVAWPRKDGELTEFFRWLAPTHAMRWRVSHNTVGYGHLYQGRYKSFPIQPGPSLLKVCRYVQRNPLTADLVERAEDWRWSSLWARAWNRRAEISAARLANALSGGLAGPGQCGDDEEGAVTLDWGVPVFRADASRASAGGWSEYGAERGVALSGLIQSEWLLPRAARVRLPWA